LQRRKPDDLIFRSYHLKNISAEEAEILLMTQFGMRQGATNVSSATEERGNRDRRQPEPVQPASASSPPLQLAADSRTNSLFVTGTAKQQTLVEEIINAIDVSEAPDGTPLGSRSNSAPYLKVYTVSGVDAGEVTKSLDSMMPGVVI
ncbi:MAG: secretin N-terminal domain-containing protein, partial [Phycisphaerae bacterium]